LRATQIGRQRPAPSDQVATPTRAIRSPPCRPNCGMTQRRDVAADFNLPHAGGRDRGDPFHLVIRRHARLGDLQTRRAGRHRKWKRIRSFVLGSLRGYRPTRIVPVSDSVMTSVRPSGASAQFVVMRPCSDCTRYSGTPYGSTSRRSRGPDWKYTAGVPVHRKPVRTTSPGRHPGKNTAPCQRSHRTQGKLRPYLAGPCHRDVPNGSAHVFSTSPFGLGRSRSTVEPPVLMQPVYSPVGSCSPVCP